MIPKAFQLLTSVSTHNARMLIIFLSNYSLKLKDILNDCHFNTQRACLTNTQAIDIFNKYLYPAASECASSCVPGMPTNVHTALANIAFAACGTLNQYVNMKALLKKKDWQSASNELKDSKWCRDVKSIRCNLDATCVVSER
ncbi:unnamed protein product [Rotaria magnacalcarata]|uniref:Uncharacterized protein n=3 Tax=Rotaria magnacalcarata TaxID=392030 RepID=A0A816UK17_9BILA|nr:unnamed protein product [Rotaria magnacalcarata]